jgi:glycosyltransferase involved in cell wall biosynthesis
VRVLLDVSAVPDQPVGAGVYTINIAEGLDASADVDLHLLARTGDERWDTLTPNATVHPEAPVRRPLRLAWEQVGAPRLAKEVRPDVWHGPHYTLPLRSEGASVVTVHDLTFFDHPEWHERAKVLYFRRMIRAAVARADVVICVSAYTAQRLRANTEPAGDIVVVPHGVDHNRFTPNASDTERDADYALLRQHGIEPPFLAFSGTMEPRKDIPTIVDGFARVARDAPDVKLVLAGGDGWGIDAVRDAVAASRVSTRIVRPGYLKDDAVAALMRQATAIVYPSLEEGFGLPALETLACGTPLVTTYGSAIEEVVGDAALLIAPGDADGLATQVRRVLREPGLADRLRAEGIARAATFTWERSVTGHLDAYRRAVPTGAAA